MSISEPLTNHPGPETLYDFRETVDVIEANADQGEILALRSAAFGENGRTMFFEPCGITNMILGHRELFADASLQTYDKGLSLREQFTYDRLSLALRSVLHISNAIGVASVYDALRDNAESLDLPTSVPELEENISTLMSPDISKKNARRMLDSLLNKAKHVGLDESESANFANLMVQVGNVGKKAFNMEVAQKLKAIEFELVGNTDAAIAYQAKLAEAISEESIHLLPQLVNHPRNEDEKRAVDTLPLCAALAGMRMVLRNRDPGINQQKMNEFCRKLVSREVVEKLLPQAYLGQAETMNLDDYAEALKPMEVDWTILPPGHLERTAREILNNDRTTGSVAPRVDLERLKVLEQIRSNWGEDKCFYAKASLRSRHTIRKDGKEYPDEYIVLVLQEHDANNNVVAEHAVAESPIVGPHAMYIYRQDVGEGFSWRDVMALSKQDARLFNARPVRHTKSGLRMDQKAFTLLSCAKEDFMRIQFNGLRGFRLPRRWLS